MELSSAVLAGFDYREQDDELQPYVMRVPARFVIPTDIPESPSTHLQKIAPEDMVKSIQHIAKCRIFSINEPYSTYETELIAYFRHQIRYGKDPEPTVEEDKLGAIFRNCDACKSLIPWLISPHYANKETGYDLCVSCKDKYPERVEEMSLTLLDIETKTREFEALSNFGQVFDWLPLYVGGWSSYECGNYIMICANPDSTLFGRLALATDDDHGRTGISVCEEDTTLADLLAEYEALRIKADKESSTDNNKEEGGGWDEFYSMPIKTMMKNRGMQIHFG